MTNNTVDIRICGRRFRIRHSNAEYVKQAASIVEKKLDESRKNFECTDTGDYMILTCLDICDDMLTAQKEIQKLKEENRKLTVKIKEQKREIDYFKKPKFIIPSPLGKTCADPGENQLCFFPVEKSNILKPAVNDLNVTSLERNRKKRKNSLEKVGGND